MNTDELRAHLDEISPSEIFTETNTDEVKVEASPEWTILEDDSFIKQMRIAKTPVHATTYSAIKKKYKPFKFST